MPRSTGTYTVSKMLGEPVRAFVPYPLPPAAPALALETFAGLNLQAELALARLAGVSGLVPSVDWLLHSAIRKEALLTSQIEGAHATLTDLFDQEGGLQGAQCERRGRGEQLLTCFPPCKRLIARCQRPADQRAPVVRGVSAFDGWGARHRQTTGRTSLVAKLGGRHPPQNSWRA
jgi:hypothetical protein